VGLDLHSKNTYMGIMEGESKKRVFQKRHGNGLGEDCKHWSSIMMR
jgi:hypothetical protein